MCLLEIRESFSIYYSFEFKPVRYTQTYFQTAAELRGLKNVPDLATTSLQSYILRSLSLLKRIKRCSEKRKI